MAKVTIDELAVMMNRQFNELRGEFKQDIKDLGIRVDKRFEIVEEKLDSVQEDVTEVRDRLRAIETTVYINHENRILKLEQNSQHKK